MADDRVVVAGGVADQDHAVDVRGVGPGVVARVGGARPGGCGLRDGGDVRGHRARAGSEEALGPVGAGEATQVGHAGAQVRAGPAVALVEEQGVLVGVADHEVVLVVDPVQSVDEEAGDAGDGLLTLERDPALPTHRRAPAVGADDQGGVEGGRRSVDGVRDRAGRDLDVADPADHRGPGRRGGVEQGLAGQGVSEVEAARDTLDHQGHGDLVAHDPVLVDAVPHRGVVRTGGDQVALEAEGLRFGDAPGLHALAPDAVGELGAGLEDRHPEPGVGQGTPQRRAPDAPAHDHHVRCRAHQVIRPQPTPGRGTSPCPPGR